jgi:multiple sugar transport system substrate-binding protein
VPFLASPPSGGRHIDSMVAGINIAVFKHTRNREAALRFVRFMTSDAEQVILNRTYGSLPSVKTVEDNAAFAAPEQKAIQQVLSTTAAPLPQVPEESQFETLVGTAMKELFADAANGKAITDDAVRQKLSQAQQQVTK